MTVNALDRNMGKIASWGKAVAQIQVAPGEPGKATVAPEAPPAPAKPAGGSKLDAAKKAAKDINADRAVGDVEMKGGSE